MGVCLSNDRGEAHDFNWSGWSEAVKLAKHYGWKAPADPRLHSNDGLELTGPVLKGLRKALREAHAEWTTFPADQVPPEAQPKYRSVLAFMPQIKAFLKILRGATSLWIE